VMQQNSYILQNVCISLSNLILNNYVFCFFFFFHFNNAVGYIILQFSTECTGYIEEICILGSQDLCDVTLNGINDELSYATSTIFGGLGGLEEGHYAAYIKGTPGEFMTDEDVDVFNGMKQAVSDMLLKNNDPTHHLCCFAVFGLATLFTLDLCSIFFVIYNCFMAFRLVLKPNMEFSI
ncbi:hypothetical protein ACJX0J_031836, partial [Zea mays]